MLVQALAGDHDRQGFDCGRRELNEWLRQVARQHQDKGLSKTFVAVGEEAPMYPLNVRLDSNPRNIGRFKRLVSRYY